MLESTAELEIAHDWARELLGEKNVAKYYMSEQNFVAAYKVESSFSFIVKGEPFYGQLYGVSPYLDSRCTDVAILGKLELENLVVRGGGFQFWEAVTTGSGSPIDILRDAAEINQLIDEHAPDSSVRPGDPEEVFWGGIRDQVGDLVACAVVVKWQSGFHVLSSVVTRTQDRGKGYATALSAGIILHSYSLGIEEIGLGVRTANIAAQRAYQRAGFKMIGAFTNYSRV